VAGHRLAHASRDDLLGIESYFDGDVDIVGEQDLRRLVSIGYPYILLNLFLSMLAAIQAPTIPRPRWLPAVAPAALTLLCAMTLPE